MFSTETTSFLRDLAANNDRDWFAANRARYEGHWKSAAEAFCDATAADLQRSSGVPVTAKLFRIHRDTRFAKDKSPYNPHVHMAFHGDGRTDMGWMVGLEADRLAVGYGLFAFAPDQLAVWRLEVDGPGGAGIADVLDRARAEGMRLDPPELKRVPAPHDKHHPRADLLRRKGLALWWDGLPPDAAFGPDGPARIAATLRRFDPLRAWMVAHLPE